MLYLVDGYNITANADSILYIVCDAWRRATVARVAVGQVVWC